MSSESPEFARRYVSSLCDSNRWNNFNVRNDDIVITTSYKAGTTWMQGICSAFVFQAPEPPAPQDELTPWLDANFGPVGDVLAQLDALSNRRDLNTRRPLDGIKVDDEIKY